MSDPPVREAGTVQADVDELVGLTNIWILCETLVFLPIQGIKICSTGVQAEGEGLRR